MSKSTTDGYFSKLTKKRGGGVNSVVYINYYAVAHQGTCWYLLGTYYVKA